jgi:DNA-binding GntR family transcriptional regulator
MPLKLTPQTLDRVAPHPPLRDQLADHIRQAIHTEDLVAGEELPSEQEIANRLTNIDKATVRRALDVVAAEGLLIKANGRRTKVAAPPPVRELDTQRYAAELARLRAGGREDTAAFVTDHGADWDDYTVDPIEYEEQPANDADAHYLGIRKGTKVMRRRMVKRINGEPLQIQRSTVLASKAKGTVLADEKAQPYPGGTLAELYDAGLIPNGAVLTVTEEARGHMPNTTERRLLQMETTGPVWNIIRVFAVDGVPVEVSRVIAPMARIVLRYETTLS